MINVHSELRLSSSKSVTLNIFEFEIISDVNDEHGSP